MWAQEWIIDRFLEENSQSEDVVSAVEEYGQCEGNEERKAALVCPGGRQEKEKEETGDSMDEEYSEQGEEWYRVQGLEEESEFERGKTATEKEPAHDIPAGILSVSHQEVADVAVKEEKTGAFFDEHHEEECGQSSEGRRLRAMGDYSSHVEEYDFEDKGQTGT